MASRLSAKVSQTCTSAYLTLTRLQSLQFRRSCQLASMLKSVEHLATNELIAAFCCPCEQALLTSAPAHRSSREFIRLWTLKEAYSKMIGLGHSVDFSSLGFSLDSLSLLHGKQGDLPPPHVHFETMWISTKTMLHHLSLAIDFSASKANHVDLQVIAPTTLVGSESAMIAPSITLNPSGKPS